MHQKLISSFLLILLSISYAFAEGPKGFFGIKLHDDTSRYFLNNELQNKQKDSETLQLFYESRIVAPKKNPYADKYSIVFDSNNKIHLIKGFRETFDFDSCMMQLNEIRRALSGIYDIDLEKSYDAFPGHSKTAYHHWGENYLEVQCQTNNSDGRVYSQIIIMTESYHDAVDEFYESGF